MNSDFPTPAEDLKRISDEIAALRRVLSEALSALTRIEKRVRASYPDYPKAKAPLLHGSAPAAPTKSRQELMTVYDGLLHSIKERGEAGFEEGLNALSEGDLLALAHELGLGGTKKMSVKKARDGIRRRLQESSQLSYRPRTPSEQPEAGPPNQAVPGWTDPT